MAAAEVLAIGIGLANSADVVLTTTTAYALKGHDSGSFVNVSLKDDGGAYRPVGSLTPGAPGTSISAPGTYRFTRPASSSSCGVFSG